MPGAIASGRPTPLSLWARLTARNGPSALCDAWGRRAQPWTMLHGATTAWLVQTAWLVPIDAPDPPARRPRRLDVMDGEALRVAASDGVTLGQRAAAIDDVGEEVEECLQRVAHLIFWRGQQQIGQRQLLHAEAEQAHARRAFGGDADAG